MRGSSGTVQAALLSTAILIGLPVAAQSDWPQWRGPARDGSVSAPEELGAWLEEPVLLWQSEVGEGYSGPVADRERIWVQARRGEREVVSSLRLSDGKELWSRSYEAPFEQDPSAAGHGLGPYSTPTLAQNRLFTISMTAVLSAWDADDGALLWKVDYSGEFDPSYTTYGSSASPLVREGLCFLHVGGPKGRELGNPGPGAMVAIRVSTGEEEWRWTGDSPNLGASPVIQEIAGQPQLIFKSRDKIVSLDPHDGNELWRIPWKVPMDNTIVTPLLIGDQLVTSDWEKGVVAWRLEKSGASWAARELWNQPDVYLGMSSPVIAEGQLVGLSYLRQGQLFGLDPASGEVLWRFEPRWGDYASLISWDGAVMVFRQDGSLIVGAVSRDRFREIRRYRLWSGRSWAHPALVGDRILVRSGDKLIAYRLTGN